MHSKFTRVAARIIVIVLINAKWLSNTTGFTQQFRFPSFALLHSFKFMLIISFHFPLHTAPVTRNIDRKDVHLTSC